MQGIKKFNRIYYIYIVIATAIIFSVSERECVIYLYETDRMYRIVLTAIGCVVALLFNLYTMFKAGNMKWEHEKQFQIISYIINIYIIILLIYMYIPIITKTDQYRIGLLRTVQDNLFVILCLQWGKINIVGKYREKVRECKRAIILQRIIIGIYFIFLFQVFAVVFTFGWRYEKKTCFMDYYFYNNAHQSSYFPTLPKGAKKKEYLRYETHFDNKTVLTFACNKNDMETYVNKVIEKKWEWDYSSIYSYLSGDKKNEGVFNQKIMDEVVAYFPYNMRRVKNLEDFEIIYFTVGEFADVNIHGLLGVRIHGLLVNYETGQIIQFEDYNKRGEKQKEWLELLEQY